MTWAGVLYGAGGVNITAQAEAVGEVRDIFFFWLVSCP